MNWLRKLILGKDFKKEVRSMCEVERYELRDQIRYAIEELFLKEDARYNDKFKSYITNATVRMSDSIMIGLNAKAKEAIAKIINSEEFIDTIVGKINRKQLS